MAVAPVTLPDAPATTRMRSRRNETLLQRLVRHRLAQIGLFIILVLVLAAFFAPFISILDPLADLHGLNKLTGEPRGPGGGFLLGADTVGRDLWTRVLYGTRVSLEVAFFAMLSSVIIGTTVGLLSGYFGGWVDGLLMRLTEIIISLPTVLIVIAFVAVLPTDPITIGKLEFDRNVFNMLMAIGLVTWTRIARAVRGEVLSLKQREFIEAAHATGCSHSHIIWRHLLPNVLPTVITLATLATATNILIEAGLSYLGLGVQAKTPSWGQMIADGQDYLFSAPWIAIAPGLAILIAVAGFNLLGQALQETLETRR